MTQNKNPASVWMGWGDGTRGLSIPESSRLPRLPCWLRNTQQVPGPAPRRACEGLRAGRGSWPTRARWLRNLKFNVVWACHDLVYSRISITGAIDSLPCWLCNVDAHLSGRYPHHMIDTRGQDQRASRDSREWKVHRKRRRHVGGRRGEIKDEWLTVQGRAGGQPLIMIDRWGHPGAWLISF